MFIRNSTVENLPADMFSANGVVIDLNGPAAKTTNIQGALTSTPIPGTLPSGLGTVTGPNNPWAYTGNEFTTWVGTGGNDRMRGGNVDDTMRGFAGNDEIDGFTGNDTLQGGNGNDAIVDTGVGTIGGDLASGGVGDDYINLGSGNADIADGNTGNDFIVAGPPRSRCTRQWRRRPAPRWERN